MKLTRASADGCKPDQLNVTSWDSDRCRVPIVTWNRPCRGCSLGKAFLNYVWSRHGWIKDQGSSWMCALQVSQNESWSEALRESGAWSATGRLSEWHRSIHGTEPVPDLLGKSLFRPASRELSYHCTETQNQLLPENGIYILAPQRRSLQNSKEISSPICPEIQVFHLMCELNEHDNVQYNLCTKRATSEFLTMPLQHASHMPHPPISCPPESKWRILVFSLQLGFFILYLVKFQAMEPLV